MNRINLTLLCALVLSCAAPAFAQRAPRTDPIGENTIPPELLVRNQQELGLSNEQMDFIRNQLQDMQAQFPEMQKTLQKEMETLGQLLSEERPDTEKTLAQLDKVLDAERAIKHAQLTMALAIRKQLSAGQLAKAKEMRQKMMEEARNRKPPPESLREKMQTMQEKLQKARGDGKDMSEIRPMMEELQPLMQGGKYKEAEEVIDRILKAMEK